MRVGCRRSRSAGGANRGEARNRDAAPALPEIVAIETVRAVANRDAGRRIGPSDLSARPAVAERKRRVGLAETAIIREPVAAGNDHAQGALHRHAKDGILVTRRTHPARILQNFRLPDLRSIPGTIMEQALVEEREV